ncbi:hypothetical protein [Myxococcus landrumensis]|uniref:IPT/TIG domain-containing protein n=1 Tax=Myxococcus landrumensis TaxID=2813577 RepID=A0ABX7MZG7_9BACT|nr:hypothetical protein [Myxococcus landrumus]QSQ11676.1 hypothetical protein JY572_25165 [Myxococcus landrumus]
MHPPASVVLPPISMGEVAVAEVIRAELAIQVLGSSFIPQCRVYLDNQALETWFVSDTELRARIPRVLLSQSTERLVDVRIPPGAPGFPGGARSPLVQVIEPTPELLSLSPETLESEPSAPVLVTVRGRNLINGSVAFFRGSRYPVTLTTPLEGTVELPPSALGATSEQTLLHLEVPGPFNIKTAALPLTVWTPTPTITGVWPPTLNAVDKLHGKAGLAKTSSLIVSGTHLRANTVMKWNGTPLTTTPLHGDKERLRAELPFDARLDAATIALTLESPSAKGPVVSVSYPLTVKAEPVLYTLSPAWVRVNATNVTFELRGEGFGEFGQQSLLWNGTPLDSRVFSERSPGTWTFRVPDALLTQPGVIPITVKRTFDGVESTPFFVQVLEESPAPLAFSLKPAVLSVGDAPGPLYIEGESFNAGSVILVNGQARTTRILSASKLTADIYPSDLERAGVLSLTVRTSAPGGGTSLPLLLPVHEERSVPFIESMGGPGGGETFPARDEPVSIKVYGQGFTPHSVVRWEGQPLPTQWGCYGSPCIAGAGERSVLEAVVPPEKARTPGVARVTVFTPGPGGGESRVRYLVLTSGLEPTLSLHPNDLDVGASSELRNGTIQLTPANLGEAHVSKLFVNDVERPFLSGTSFLLSPEERSTEGVLEVRIYAAGRGKSAPAYLYVHGAKTPRLLALSPAVLSLGSSWGNDSRQDFWLEGQDFYWDFDSELDSRATVHVEGLPVPLRSRAYPRDGAFSTTRIPMEVPGVLPIRVSRVAEGGGSSLPALLNVVAERPSPLLTKLEPMTAVMGAPHLKLQVQGKGIHPTSELRWKEFRSKLVRVFDSVDDADHFEADLPAAALATPGVVEVTLETPPPGGGISLPIRVVVE